LQLAKHVTGVAESKVAVPPFEQAVQAPNHFGFFFGLSPVVEAFLYLVSKP
jgi:hypothetical protein